VLFAAILAALMFFTTIPSWISACIAAIAGLCVSYIFFRPQRDAVALDIAARRERGASNADSDEDDALDRTE
jgi:hypothetical protein